MKKRRKKKAVVCGKLPSEFETCRLSVQKRNRYFQFCGKRKKKKYFLELCLSLDALTHILVTYHFTGHLLIISVFPISVDLVFQGEIKCEV